MSDPLTIGTIIISTLPAALPAVYNLVKAWVTRGRPGRTVKFKGKVGGQTIEFTGNPEELEAILANVASRRKSAESSSTPSKNVADNITRAKTPQSRKKTTAKSKSNKRRGKNE